MNDNILFLLVWLFLWYLVWGVYNMLFLPNGLSLVKSPLFSGSLFLLSSIVPLYLTLGDPAFSFLLFLVPLLILNKKGVYWAVYLDVFFQQVFLLWLFTYYQGTSYGNIIFVAVFTFSHLPILFLKHLKWISKILILAAVPFGALVFLFCYTNVQLFIGLLIASLIHGSFYFIIMKFLRHLNLGIVV